MKKLKYFYRVLTSAPLWDAEPQIYRREAVASLFLCLAAGIMLVMNLRNGARTMAVCSVVLVVGFLFSAAAALITKKETISRVIIALLVCFVLSVFAVTGGNGGFAILWILLVPFFSVSLLGPVPGFLLATYFLLFLFLLFYSPLRVFIADKYPATYLSRFPIIYAFDYSISMFLALQAEYFHRIVRMQSYTDDLTQVFNRRYLVAQLRSADAEKNTLLSILVIDVNGLKQVNDRFGHEAGDQLLCTVADCCRNVLPQNAILARMGGDEFAILLRGSAAEASQLEARIRSNAAEQYADFGTLSFSIGTASREQHPGLSAFALLSAADSEMYRAKAAYYSQGQHDRRARDRRV